METSLLVVCSLVFVNLIAFVLRKAGLPIVLGFILAGIFLSLPLLQDLFSVQARDIIGILGMIGLGALMFVAGLEISWYMFVKEEKDAFFVALFGLLVPFVIGFVAMLWIGQSLATALIIAVCMSITAEATTAEVLLDLKKIKTRIGALLMGAGIIDDVAGMIGFAVIGYFMIYSFDFAEVWGLLIVLGSFLVGMLVHKYIGRHTKVVSVFEEWVGILIVPFFFVEMGMHFSFASVFVNPELIAVIVVIAFFGKFLGVFMSRLFVKLNKYQACLVGFAMNSRGAVELALAYTGYKIGFLSIDLYSAIIVMTFVTTFVFPFVIMALLKKHKGIMD